VGEDDRGGGQDGRKEGKREYWRVHTENSTGRVLKGILGVIIILRRGSSIHALSYA